MTAGMKNANPNGLADVDCHECRQKRLIFYTK
jgi:hypothetical protein